MKHVIIRKATFETNSSSTHSYTVMDNRKSKKIIPDSKGIVNIPIEYSIGENDSTNSEEVKAVIACPYWGIEAVKEAIKNKTGATEVNFTGSDYQIKELGSEDDKIFTGEYSDFNPVEKYSLEEFIFDNGISVAYVVDGQDY